MTDKRKEKRCLIRRVSGLVSMQAGMWTSMRLKIWHSPSNATQPKSAYMCRDLELGQGLGEDVGCHVVCGAIDESECAICDSLPDEVEVDVNVLGPGMVVVFNGKLDRSLVVAVECGWGRGKGEQFENKASKPDGFFGRVRRGNILGFAASGSMPGCRFTTCFLNK